MNITDLSACELSAAVRGKRVSCREVMLAYLDRIHRVNPSFNAIVSLRGDDELLREADACDTAVARAQRSGQVLGWMHGLPQAIKDLSNTAGIRTTLASPLMRDHVPADDALMVQRMKAAGCIVIGKTNTPEFGLGSHTFNEVFGVTRNAWNPHKSAGGSSGGAAVALAQRMLPVADGSDFMGSLRNPAGWNHVFGLRPSQGRVPAWPANDVWVTQLGTEGPMGRTVADVAQLLQVQAGPDVRTPLAIATHEDFGSNLDSFDPRGTRIGWLGDLGGHLAMEPGILELCELGLRRFESLGCHVEAASPGFSPDAVWQAWLVWRRWLVAARIAPFLARPGGRDLIKAEALWEHDQAAGLSGAEVLQASAKRTVFLQQMLALLARFDVLALPTAQVWPFDAGLRWPTHIHGREMDTYHRWMEVTLYASFAGLPCISVPLGFGDEGLPMGLQLIGQPQGEVALLQLARAYEPTIADLLARSPPDGMAHSSP